MSDLEASNSDHHALVIPENTTDIEDLRSLDAEGLRHYAEEPVAPDDPLDSIRKLIRIAFRKEQAITATEAGSLLFMTGLQIDEPNISRDLATMLRTTSDEGVYPGRLTSVEGWWLTSTMFKLRESPLSAPAARVLVAGMGVDRGVLTDALGAKSVSIPKDTNRLAVSIHSRPAAYQGLAAVVAGALAPLELPELPPQPRQTTQLEWALGRVLLNRKGYILRRKATTGQGSSMIDAMCLRYLDRPFIKSHLDDPEKPVSLLRQFCSGVRLVTMAGNEYATQLDDRIKVLLRAFRDSITSADLQQLEQFVDGKTSQPVLERSDPPRVIQWRRKLQEKH
jgi:hypothetical protein